MSSNPEVPAAKTVGRMDDEQALRAAASGEVYQTTQFADAVAGQGYNYVTTLPSKPCERVGLGDRVGVSRVTIGGARVVVLDPHGSDVAVLRSSGSQARLSAASVMDAFGIKERVRDGDRVTTLWVTDGERVFGAVPGDGWFLGAVGME